MSRSVDVQLDDSGYHTSGGAPSRELGRFARYTMPRGVEKSDSAWLSAGLSTPLPHTPYEQAGFGQNRELAATRRKATHRVMTTVCGLFFSVLLSSAPAESDAPAPDSLPPMLDLPGSGQDPTKIDFAALPVVRGDHAVITRGDAAWKFRLHNYLAYFDGKYWCAWSHGPVVEDNPTQHVRYSTSRDGLQWSEAKAVMGSSPREGFRYISRGLWVRDGRLIALASHDEALDENGKVRFFGKSLELLAFAWDEAAGSFQPLGVVYDDAINNFPPRRLPDGKWGMMRRDHRRRITMLVGGVESPLEWSASPLLAYAAADGFRPEEPDWWTLADGRLLGLFRDNGGSHRFYRAVSRDNGRTWSAAERTNFPDATSKFFCLRTSAGFYVLISNPNPEQRNPLCLSTSDDGVTFTRMARLPIPERLAEERFARSRYKSTKYASLQYPHAIERDGHLLIAFSRRKQTVEVVKIPLDELERLRRDE